MSLEELSRATRIVRRHLQALEEDRLHDLPAPVFVRGFIRSYCAAVGEPPDGALSRYEAWVATTGPAPARVPPTVRAEPRRGRGLRGPALAPSLVVVVVMVVVGGAIYLLTSSPASRGTERPRQPDQVAGSPAALPGSDVAVSVALSAATPGLVAPTPTVPGSAQGPGHVLVARVHELTWVSVRPEDGLASQELLEPGTIRAWRSAGRFTVTLGNAGGVSLELDGVALPRLGDRGRVVRELRLPREPSP